MLKVLIVEDSCSLADTLKIILEKENYYVDVVYNGKKGYEYAVSGMYDIVLLDLMLPELNGYQILKKIRIKNIDIPVIIISAKSELDDKIDAFQFGADDYLIKPFEIKELIMRIEAVARRGSNTNTITLECGNLKFDHNTCEMINKENDKSVKISGKELQLFEYFIQNKSHVLRKEQITESVWGYDSEVYYNNVEVYISFLRRKLKQIKVNARIRTVRGVGYILEEEGI